MALPCMTWSSLSRGVPQHSASALPLSLTQSVVCSFNQEAEEQQQKRKSSSDGSIISCSSSSSGGGGGSSSSSSISTRGAARKGAPLTYPPLPKYYRGAVSCRGINSSGLPEKSVTWLLEIISGEIRSMALLASLAGSQRSVRRCNWGRTRITESIGNALSGTNSGRINLEQLPENW